MTVLHPHLTRDTVALGDTGLSRVRWMNDRRFPWLLLIPKHDDVREWHLLPVQAQHQLLDELMLLSRALETAVAPDRINLGALGNRVPQLHLHVIARHEHDPCWPGPVWGQGEAQTYAAGEEPFWLAALWTALPGDFLEPDHD
jgi:diadenosine tetraphosphate (Ap4A) HIT family hydrolase